MTSCSSVWKRANPHRQTIIPRTVNEPKHTSLQCKCMGVAWAVLFWSTQPARFVRRRQSMIINILQLMSNLDTRHLPCTQVQSYCIYFIRNSDVHPSAILSPCGYLSDILIQLLCLIITSTWRTLVNLCTDSSSFAWLINCDLKRCPTWGRHI